MAQLPERQLTIYTALCLGRPALGDGLQKRFLEPFIERVFPQLAGVPIEFSWGGHLDISMQRTPDIGGADNRYWLQGYSGHGVLPTLAGARAVADAILGNSDELALYQGLRNPRFPGGELLAAPLEAVGKAWYRLRDFV